MNELDPTARLRTRIERLRRHLAVLEARVPSELLPGEAVPLLLARIRDDAVAFVLQSVDEVLPMVRLASLPESAPWVCGMLDYHGELVPVLDAGARWGGERRVTDEGSRIVLVTVEGNRRGFVVDEVQGIRTAPRGELMPSPADAAAARYLAAIWEHDGVPVLVLDLRHLIAPASRGVEGG